jgi:hypothetical protein
MDSYISPGLTIKTLRFVHIMYACAPAVICLYNIHRLVFLIWAHYVLCKVRTCVNLYVSCRLFRSSNSYLSVYVQFLKNSGYCRAHLVEALLYKPEGGGFDSRWCHWNFSFTFFRSHCGPGFDSASNRNEYQEYFLGGKGCRCVGLTALPPSCADCLEIWEPQPPGTLRTCIGIALYRYGISCCWDGLSSEG